VGPKKKEKKKEMLNEQKQYGRPALGQHFLSGSVAQTWSCLMLENEVTDTGVSKTNQFPIYLVSFLARNKGPTSTSTPEYQASVLVA